MRLWSLHPGLLDRQGLLAVWREGLLAQKVLGGQTHGYRSHPQLRRFREHPAPTSAIAAFLHAVADEAGRRGYRFDRTRIGTPDRTTAPILVTTGQLRFEARHLANKLRVRTPETLPEIAVAGLPAAHPLFRVVAGPVAAWERTTAPPSGSEPP